MSEYLPRSLRPRREKIFGPAPSYRLDGNAKARVWAAAQAWNTANRQPRQHQGPLTWATLRVLRTLLWRFHGADGGGRCFPAYEKIATAAKCARSSVAVAIKELEDAGLLTWVNRIVRIRRQERDLFGHWVTVMEVVRTSNAYRFLDPIAAIRGRKPAKSENRTGPPEARETKDGTRRQGPSLIPGETSRAPPEQTARPAIALQREHSPADGALLSNAERTALIARLDTSPTKADWRVYEGQIEAMLRAAH